MMPEPKVKRGTQVKPRSRNKNGKWRKKRSDVGKPRTKKDVLEVELPVGAEPEYVLECETCDNCEKVMGLPACLEDGSVYEWGCVGLIIKPEDPNDIHDALNKIRICIESSDPSKLTTHEWTPWEAQMITVAMSIVVAKYLESGQPTHDQVNELLNNGYKDRDVNLSRNSKED